MLATYRRTRRRPPYLLVLVVAAGVLAGSSACSGGDDDDIVVLSLPATPVATTNLNSGTEDPGVGRDQAAVDTSASSAGAGDGFVSEAVAEANQAEKNHVPTPTPTLIPRGGTPTENPSPSGQATPAPTSTSPQTRTSEAVASSTPDSETPASAPTASNGTTTGSVREWERPAACSDGYERVYEAFSTDTPPIGIAICVSPDGRAEYLGLDVATNNRIRLSACVSGTDFVANNGDSVYVVDIAQDTIRYPQAPGGRHLDAVTVITSASTIPALGC